MAVYVNIMLPLLLKTANCLKAPYHILTLLKPLYQITEFDDSRYFHSLRKLREEMAVPIEELVKPISITIRQQSFNISIMICEDGWTTNYSISIPKLLAKNGADVLCNISCSPFHCKKNPKRHQIFWRAGQGLSFTVTLLQ